MEGFDVVTFDDEKVGTVVGESGDYLIVEHGLIRKSKRALPREFAHVDDGEQQVRITVGKEMFLGSPELDGELDERAVAEYYGLAQSATAPASSAEEQAQRAGVETAVEERARIREGEPEIEESPALLGDRMAGVEAERRKER
jgi:nucleotide-binding universal stress UspA family protein